MKNKFAKKVAAIFIICAMLLQIFSVAVFAAEPTIDTRKVDPSTMTDWQNYFGQQVLNTENAGGVWGDKSVFLNADAFNAALEDGVADYDINFNSDGTNFLVALSAIASNKSIVGYSAIPTDTVFVLDLSNSMSSTAMTNMINAANDAIKRLNALNPNNRVGVVLYAGESQSYWSNTFVFEDSATLLLGIDRYTAGQSGNFLTYSNGSVSVASGVLSGQNRPSMRAEGATYIQAGVQLAIDAFNSVTDTKVESGVQAGTKRMPVLVLMSDGAPTVATTSFNNVGDSNRGNGSSTSSAEVFLTQLTNAFAKKEMAEKYERSGLFYTLGLNVGDSIYARAVLDPTNADTPYTTYWDNYNNATGNSITISGSGISSFTVPVINGLEKTYVDQYFSASSDNALQNAFAQIVNQIIIQSKYYPTLVDDGQHHLDGYISFNDELGALMVVRDIKGITVGGNLYRGSAIVKELKQGTFGDIYTTGNMNNLNSAGLEFLSVVEKRLGCTQDEAATVVVQALMDGQLRYENDNDFSNYIGWYADANGNFLGYWNGKNHNNKHPDAVYANKSYGFMGLVGSEEEFNKTDMLHISVQVHEHIEKGHQTVIYKIPAALIPTVNYSIEFDGTDLATGTNFEMTIGGANEAIRLVYEAGLREDINRINVAEKVLASGEDIQEVNGVYRFYSNAWKAHTHTTTQTVDVHDSTFFEFEPSLENERYYYTADSLIYKQTQSGYQLVTTDPRNTGGTYYTAYPVFVKQNAQSNAALMQIEYVPISEETLDLARQNSSGWYIPKDSIHRLLIDSTGQDYHILKTTNATETLSYSNYPQVVFLQDKTLCDACLGNNGTFTLEAAEGIKLTKTVEVEGLGANQIFEFEIALQIPANITAPTSYPIYDIDGNYLRDEAVSSGKINISLTEGETVYIADIPAGTEYTVTELFAQNSNWAVKTSVNGSGTIAENIFSDVQFENRIVSNGNLIVHKTTVLPQNIGQAEYSGSFDVKVVIIGDDDGKVKVDGIEKELSGGGVTFRITDNQNVIISEIAAGATYSVTEENLTSGWVLDENQSTGLTGTIVLNQNAVASLVNTYTAQSVLGNAINLEGIKNVMGREWIDADYYEFRLERYNGTNWVPMGSVKSVTKNTPDKKFTMNDILSNYEFTAVGEYQFRVVELPTDIGGINYDYIAKTFTVSVIDDFTGKLKIGAVTTNNPSTSVQQAGTIIETANNGYNVKTIFNNQYSVAGTANITINIQKALNNTTGIQRDKSGFEFVIYQYNGSNQKINEESLGATDENGNITYTKSFDAAFVGQTLTYYVAEKNLGEMGMQYDTSEKQITIDFVDNLDGTVSAKIRESNQNKIDLGFTNTYSLNPATIEIEATKSMTGRALSASDISVLTFQIFKTDNSSFANPVFVQEKGIVGGKINFQISESTVGLKYYTIKEKASGIPGVTDDAATFYLTVEVKKDNTDTLTYEIVEIKKDQTAVNKIEFVNSYAPNQTAKAITVKKTLSGRDIVNGEFGFVLTDENGTPLQTKTVNNGEVKFDSITYTEAGEHIYYVTEIIGNAEGITYDQSKYKVVVTVTDDLSANLTATVKYYNADGGEIEEIVFQNTYTPIPESPKTSDKMGVLEWIAAFFVGSTTILGVYAVTKKRKEIEE